MMATQAATLSEIIHRHIRAQIFNFTENRTALIMNQMLILAHYGFLMGWLTKCGKVADNDFGISHRNLQDPTVNAESWRNLGRNRPMHYDTVAKSKKD